MLIFPIQSNIFAESRHNMVQSKNYLYDYRNTFNTKMDVKNHKVIVSMFLDERGNVSVYMLIAI